MNFFRGGRRVRRGWHTVGRYTWKSDLLQIEGCQYRLLILASNSQKNTLTAFLLRHVFGYFIGVNWIKADEAPMKPWLSGWQLASRTGAKALQQKDGCAVHQVMKMQEPLHVDKAIVTRRVAKIWSPKASPDCKQEPSNLLKLQAFLT